MEAVEEVEEPDGTFTYTCLMFDGGYLATLFDGFGIGIYGKVTQTELRDLRDARNRIDLDDVRNLYDLVSNKEAATFWNKLLSPVEQRELGTVLPNVDTQLSWLSDILETEWLRYHLWGPPSASPITSTASATQKFLTTATSTSMALATSATSSA